MKLTTKHSIYSLYIHTAVVLLSLTMQILGYIPPIITGLIVLTSTVIVLLFQQMVSKQMLKDFDKKIEEIKRNIEEILGEMKNG